MNPKQHAKRNTVLRVIAFLLIVALVYGALTRLLTINSITEQQYIRSFYLEPKNSLDVMILGASETFTDYCAPLAWQHAGFTSYPLAVCEDNTRRYTCEKLDEFSPVFADCR